jgi:hypothetical protein
MLCRRGLESGFAAIYMWDLPHEFWAWKKFDGELSFGAAIAYLSSPAYGAHIAALNELSGEVSFLDSAALRKLYHKLSNTVHGKYDDLAPLSPQRYSPDQITTLQELSLLIESQNFLICAWRKRFPEIDKYMDCFFPSLARTPIQDK